MFFAFYFCCIFVNADDLLQIYQQALKSDTILLKAKADRDAMYDEIGVSRARLLPQLSAQLGYNYAFDLAQDYNKTSYGVALTQSLYNYNNFVYLDIAHQYASRAELSYQMTQQELILRTVRAYLNVLSSKDNLEYVIANQKAIERQLEQTLQKYKVGLSPIIDVQEAQAKFDLSSAQAISAENILQNSYETLNVITGLEHKSLKKLNMDTFSPQMVSPSRFEQWKNIAESTNVVLLMGRLDVEIAKKNIQLARSGYFPTLDAGLSYAGSHTNYKESNIPSVHIDGGDVGVTLRVPIFSGLSNYKSVQAKMNKKVSAQEQLEYIQRDLYSNIRSELNNIQASLSSIKAYEQSVISAKTALKAAETGFEVGTRTILDILEATQSLYNAEKLLSDSRYQYINHVLNLKYIAGTINDEDLYLINEYLI